MSAMLAVPIATGVRRLLVGVRDDATRALLANALRDHGFAVDCAASHAEAEAQLAACSYDLVIAELGLPGRSGHEVTTVARARAVPVVLITSGSEQEYQMLSAGLHYLSKPFSFMDLLMEIDRCACLLGGKAH